MAEQPVIFSASVENLIDKICKDQTQQPLDRLARRRLAAIDEQLAFTLLDNISKCKIEKSLNAYVVHMLKQPPYKPSPSKPSPSSPSTISSSKPSSLLAPPSTPPPVAKASNVHNTNASGVQLLNVFPLHSPVTTSPTKKEEKLLKIEDFPQQLLNTALLHISTLEGNTSMSSTSPSVSDEKLHDCLTLSSTHHHFPSFDNFVEELRHKVTHIRNLNKSAINPHIIEDQWKNCIAFVNDWMNINVECGQKIVDENTSSNPHIIINREEPTMSSTRPIQSQPVQFSATEEDRDNLAGVFKSKPIQNKIANRSKKIENRKKSNTFGCDWKLFCKNR